HGVRVEHRGLGDIFFLTAEEYDKRSPLGKMRYQLFRNPFIQFVISPVLYLTVTLRIPFPRLKGWEKLKRNHLIDNGLLILIYAGLCYLLGWKAFLLIQGSILFVFGIIAYWFFYVQHQHEDNYNEQEKGDWDHLIASIRGSTFYDLPQVFHWATGSIGYHHIHHLNSSIPNYNLAACARENPVLNKYVLHLGFVDSLKFIHHKLWDEEEQRMISFREFRKKQKLVLIEGELV
ncbi:MAG: fatty acid desaturase, partial [Bacteroidota bacterium]